MAHRHTVDCVNDRGGLACGQDADPPNGPETGIWEYNPITGIWRLFREAFESEADVWLAMVYRQEPNKVFVASKRRPTKKPANTPEAYAERAYRAAKRPDIHIELYVDEYFFVDANWRMLDGRTAGPYKTKDRALMAMERIFDKARQKARG